MNNEQTKTPGQIAYEADGYFNWDIQNKYLHERWERVASAVISYVLQGAKWVLLEPGVMMLEGDETWSHFLWSWVPAARTRVCDADICRRPISLPSSVRPDGKSEGPSTTPPASSGDAGTDVQSAWVPKFKVGDRVRGLHVEGQGTVKEVRPTKEYVCHCDTGCDTTIHEDRLLLVQSAEPVVEENPAYFAHALIAESMRAEAVEFQRDQLRKELKEAKRKLKDSEASVFWLKEHNAVLKREGLKVSALTTENAALKEKLQGWESAASVGHPTPCNLGPLCPYCEIERLRSQFRWIPISERLPTEKDAVDGLVWVWKTKSLLSSISEISYKNVLTFSNRYTHWMIPIPCPPSPPETEEQAMRREFEEWYHATSLSKDRSVALWTAWQAAKSTGGQA